MSTELDRDLGAWAREELSPGTIARRARVGRRVHPRGPRPSDGRRGGRRGAGCRVGVGGARCQDRRPGSRHPAAPSAGAQDPLDRRRSRARVRRDRVRGRIAGVAWWIADRVARGIRPDPRPSALRRSRIERPTKRARSERTRGVALRRRPPAPARPRPADQETTARGVDGGSGGGGTTKPGDDPHDRDQGTGTTGPTTTTGLGTTDPRGRVRPTRMGTEPG